MKLVAEGGDIWLTILLTLETDCWWYEGSNDIMEERKGREKRKPGRRSSRRKEKDGKRSKAQGGPDVWISLVPR